MCVCVAAKIHANLELAHTACKNDLLTLPCLFFQPCGRSLQYEVESHNSPRVCMHGHVHVFIIIIIYADVIIRNYGDNCGTSTCCQMHNYTLLYAGLK